MSERRSLPQRGGEYQEILSRLERIENGARTPVIPLIDPTANVLQLVEKGLEAEADLRRAGDTLQRKLGKQEAKWRNKLAAAEAKRLDAERQQESGRVNALLEANTSNVALALEKQGAQAQAQDRRIAVLEQNQYQTGGRDIQRSENRGQSNFTISQLVAGAGVLLVALIELHARGII